MTSPLLSATIQGVLLSALSNVLAQVIRAYQRQEFSKVDLIQLLQFVLCSLLSTPPNFTWQKYLEDTFPASESKVRGDSDAGQKHERLSIKNTAIKFLLEQTLGAAFNTVLYIAMMNMFKGAGFGDIMTAIHKNFWPMILASYNVWPLVTLLNLVVVPFEWRILVGGSVGVLWGVYLSMKAI